MIDIQPGQVWEVYSDNEGQWTRMIVEKIEDGNAVLRYEGIIDFLSVPVSDLDQKPETYRQAERTPPAC